MMKTKPSLLAQILSPIRRLTGLFLLAFAILGFVMPIIPGWPFIVPAIVLLGRRDPWLRQLHLLVRNVLRWMRRSNSATIRQAGLRLSVEYVRGKRMITPAIIAAEYHFGRFMPS